jgi:hypothetical protein
VGALADALRDQLTHSAGMAAQGRYARESVIDAYGIEHATARWLDVYTGLK